MCFLNKSQHQPLTPHTTSTKIGFFQLSMDYYHHHETRKLWDCSGFTSYLFHHFGYKLSRTTYTQVRDGIKVSSLSEAKIGDLILYDGHVALLYSITRSNGKLKTKIVHARSVALGTATSEDAAYRPIVAIRRIIY